MIGEGVAPLAGCDHNRLERPPLPETVLLFR